MKICACDVTTTDRPSRLWAIWAIISILATVISVVALALTVVDRRHVRRRPLWHPTFYHEDDVASGFVAVANRIRYRSREVRARGYASGLRHLTVSPAIYMHTGQRVTPSFYSPLSRDWRRRARGPCGTEAFLLNLRGLSKQYIDTVKMNNNKDSPKWTGGGSPLLTCRE